ncbi:hypothetical protein DWW10_20690 [Bacteroides intestinalis]|uniref:Uncharacterized protein n=1 Tax=Bacteroides intestinalis TaxID=329854 RepID=A0A412XUU5_9BACE|nr:hypothetical protein [Bacteroides intestinalis]RGV48974.1 hypothetical protein DWW10_20690 [Bacteroides intestinalis]
MKILLETGWSDYIPGGVIFGNPSLHEKTPEEKELEQGFIIEMAKDFINHNPEKENEFISVISK